MKVLNRYKVPYIKQKIQGNYSASTLLDAFSKIEDEVNELLDEKDLEITNLKKKLLDEKDLEITNLKKKLLVKPKVIYKVAKR